MRIVKHQVFSALCARSFVFDNDFAVFSSFQQRFDIAFHFRVGGFVGSLPSAFEEQLQSIENCFRTGISLRFSEFSRLGILSEPRFIGFSRFSRLS